MRNKTLAAGIALVTIFTLSCDNNGSGDRIEMCGGVEYHTSDYNCVVGELVGKCRGKDYYPAYQICNNGVIESKTPSSSSGRSSSSGVSSSSSRTASSSSNGTSSSSSSYEQSSSSGVSSSSSGTASSSSNGTNSSSSSIMQSSSSNNNVVYGTPVSYGGETYETVVIGAQTWFKRNLNYEVEGSRCYDNNNANCDKYGRLYDWATANTICPAGWHLPNNDDLYELLNYVDGNTDNECQFNYDYATAICATLGKYLKSTNGWDSENGLDIYGFSAIPNEPNKNTPDYSLYGSSWWTSDDKFGSDNSNVTYANKYSMYYEDNGFQMSFSHKNNWYSIRCVKD